MYLAHLILGNEILTRMTMGKIEGTKLRARQRLMWLRNIKDWTGMTLEMIMNEIKKPGQMEKNCAPTANCKCNLDGGSLKQWSLQ